MMVCFLVGSLHISSFIRATFLRALIWVCFGWNDPCLYSMDGTHPNKSTGLCFCMFVQVEDNWMSVNFNKGPIWCKMLPLSLISNNHLCLCLTSTGCFTDCCRSKCPKKQHHFLNHEIVHDSGPHTSGWGGSKNVCRWEICGDVWAPGQACFFLLGLALKVPYHAKIPFTSILCLCPVSELLRN